MMMRFSTKSKTGRRGGFTLIELAIVLAITSLLAAGLWRMMASGNTQLRDQAAADMHKQIINAVRGYLASANGQTQLTALGPNFEIVLPCVAPHADLCLFLPTGFTAASTNAYNQTYTVGVSKNTAAAVAPTSYSFMVKTAGGEVIPDTSGGRISSMIGNDGGFIYGANVCGAGLACGAFGTWSAAPATFALAGAAGEIASRTFVGSNAATNTPWLARELMNVSPNAGSGLDDFNTIQTNVSLGGNTLWGNTSVAGSEGGSIENLGALTINRADPLGAASLIVNGCTRLLTSDATCTDMVSINGGVNITGLLSANTLYASQFIYTASDSRLKKDIVPLINVLEKFKQMRGYSFVLKGGTSTQYGVMAQEVEKVFPAVVHEEKGEDYKTVDYMGLVGPLVGAVNELANENEKLKADIEKLTKAVAEIKRDGKKK